MEESSHEKTIISSLICCAAMSVFANSNADQLTQLSAAADSSKLPIAVQIQTNNQINNKGVILKVMSVVNAQGYDWDSNKYHAGDQVANNQVDALALTGQPSESPEDVLSTIQVQLLNGDDQTSFCKLSIPNVDKAVADYDADKASGPLSAFVDCSGDKNLGFNYNYNSESRTLVFTAYKK